MKLGQTPVEQEWFRIHTRYGSCEVALNPSGREFKDLYRKLSEPYARYQRKHEGAFPPGVEDGIARRCAAEAVLRGWREGAPEDEDGNALPFTPENAMRVFEDPVIGDPFLKGVMDAAAGLWDAFAEEVDETAKN